MTSDKLTTIPATSTWLMTVAIGLGAACDDTAPTGDPGNPVDWDRAQYPLVTGIRDSAGVRVIENARPAEDSRLLWRIGAGPMVSIGEATGEEPYLLHQVMDALMLPDRRVVIANTGTSEIRVYDAEGVHQATWGGDGGGPGEFQALAGIARWPGDSILAWQAMQSPSGAANLWGGSVFDATGELGRSFRIESDDGSGLQPRVVLAGGEILGRMTTGGADDGYWRYEAAYSLVAGEGARETHAYCTACHSERIVAQQGLTRADWEEVLEQMIEENGMTPIEEPDLGRVLAYLSAHYGPDRPNFPNR